MGRRCSIACAARTPRTPRPRGRETLPLGSTLAHHAFVHDQESARERDDDLDPAEHERETELWHGEETNEKLDSGDHEDRAERSADRASRGDENRDARRDEPERGDLGGDPARILADQWDGHGLAGSGTKRREARRSGRGRDDRREPEPPPGILAVRAVARGDVKDSARDERSAAFDRELRDGQLTRGDDVGGKRYAEQRDRRVAQLT